jgi:hypothetical protein
MRILVACEESQAITKELRALGHEAYSCDLLPCSGGHPEWHFQEDVFEVIEQGARGDDGELITDWDMLIAHPPCTYLAVSGARWMYHSDDLGLPMEERRPHPMHPNRRQHQKDALDFVQRLMDAPIDKIAIENPISVISTQIRKPDQIVHPWMFGDKASKSTCLWLKNLPLLTPTDVVEKGEWKEWTDSRTGKKKRQATWYYEALCKAKTDAERRTLRSKTFKGMAQAIADQWTKNN